MKFALLLAMFCAVSFGAETKFTIKSMRHIWLEEPKFSREIAQIYDASARRVISVTTTKDDKSEKKSKEINLFNKKGELISKQLYDYDFTAKKWKQTYLLKIDRYKNGMQILDYWLKNGKVDSAYKMQIKNSADMKRVIKYELKEGKWQKEGMKKTIKNGNGNVLLEVKYKRDGATWLPTRRTIYHYGKSTKRLGYEEQICGAVGCKNNIKVLIIAGKNEKSYTQITSEFKDGVWQSAGLITQIYDAKSHTDTRMTYVKDPQTKAWQNESKELTLDDENGLAKTQNFTWERDAKAWKSSFESKQTYDKEGKTLSDFYIIEEDSGEKRLFSYDENGANNLMEIYDLIGYEGDVPKWDLTQRVQTEFNKSVLKDEVMSSGADMLEQTNGIYAPKRYARYKINGDEIELIEETTWEYERIK